ncbi:hypothetical protein NDU88_007555 [Pleurodeles waltl]|uniref:Uncharacterized protein n=1 Tax=Pleurodeles waltl TaxID=8319 RepID=A0AAV7N5Q3_PLEWA|nr:hypothetical protein NDU88_007555 [Pleurodeles waltl]
MSLTRTSFSSGSAHGSRHNATRLTASLLRLRTRLRIQCAQPTTSLLRLHTRLRINATKLTSLKPSHPEELPHNRYTRHIMRRSQLQAG